MSLARFLGGGSNQSSYSTSLTKSGNRNEKLLDQNFRSDIIGLKDANRNFMSLLGLGKGGRKAANRDFKDFRDRSGFSFVFDEGVRGMNAANSAAGNIFSGSALKAGQQYGQQMGHQYLSNYLDRLAQGTNQRIGMGQLLSDAGKFSSSRSRSIGRGSSDNGVGGFLGSIISGIAASERRLKNNIVKLTELEDGLGIYSFSYKGSNNEIVVGTMVDEVEKLRPWALGPVTSEGIRTVNYDKLEKE